MAADDVGTLVQWCIAPSLSRPCFSDGFETGLLNAWSGYTPP